MVRGLAKAPVLRHVAVPVADSIIGRSPITFMDLGRGRGCTSAGGRQGAA